METEIKAHQRNTALSELRGDSPKTQHEQNEIQCFRIQEEGVLGPAFQPTNGGWYSDPYHHLKRMQCAPDQTFIKIEFWADIVTIMGRGLAPVFHALRRGYDVEVIALPNAEMLVPAGKVAVSEIVIEKRVRKKAKEETRSQKKTMAAVPEDDGSDEDDEDEAEE
jgi:hypothetical protein